jgi:predicted nucleic acid-binding protein
MARATARAAQPLNVVDSSAWLEYLTGGPQAARFADAIEDSKRLVPAIVLYEVFKKVLRERGEHQALQVAGAMHAQVVPVDATLALDAARYRSRWRTASSTPPLSASGLKSGRRTMTSKGWPACGTLPRLVPGVSK